MAARGVPLRTLQEVLQQERENREFWRTHEGSMMRQEDYLPEQRRRKFWAAVGPLKPTEKMAEIRETGRMMQQDPEKMTD